MRYKVNVRIAYGNRLAERNISVRVLETVFERDSGPGLNDLDLAGSKSVLQKRPLFQKEMDVRHVRVLDVA